MRQARMTLVGTLSFVAAMCLSSAVAHAFQVSVGISRDLIGAIQLTEDQKTTVAKFVQDHRAGLASDKPEEVMAARQALLDPLMTPQASIGTGFRFQFSSDILDSLRPLVSGKSDANAINALIIAGEVGTQGCVELLGQGLTSASPSVRRAAAYGMQRTFLALENHSPAMIPSVAESIISTIEARLKTEEDPQVVLALVEAAIEGSKLRGTNGQFNLGNSAIESLCKSLNARASIKGAKAMDPVEIQAVLNAIAGARDLVGGRGGVAVPNTVHLAAAELAGRLLAHGKRVVTANGLGFDDAQRRDLYATACDAGVALAGIAGDKLQPGYKFPSPTLGTSLRKGDKLSDGTFLKGCEDCLAALAGAPFNLPVASFK